MNPFKINDIVNFSNKFNGRVICIACEAATRSGGNTCSKSTCHHPDKDYVWVEWSLNNTYSYHHSELRLSRLGDAVRHFKTKVIQEMDDNDYWCGG